jgi:hypothetical protein
MASRAYDLFAVAMRERKQVICTYAGHRRELCPVILGHGGGEEKALTYQFGGSSGSGLPPGGQWRCLSLARITNITLRNGPCHSDAAHRRPQGCVDQVDLDVNPTSPYSPKRRLG